MKNNFIVNIYVAKITFHFKFKKLYRKSEIPNFVFGSSNFPNGKLESKNE